MRGGGGGGSNRRWRDGLKHGRQLYRSQEIRKVVPPPPEVHAGDQLVIGDIFLECQLDVTAGDRCSTGD